MELSIRAAIRFAPNKLTIIIGRLIPHVGSATLIHGLSTLGL